MLTEINTMKPKFTWIAIYKDESKLYEYEDKTQHLFKEIDLNKLNYFVITDGIKEFFVNVITGEFNLNGLLMRSFSLPQIVEDSKLNNKYRLIWFKRIRKTFKSTGVITKIFYCFGLQTTINEKNYQQLVWVDDQGRIIINGAK